MRDNRAVFIPLLAVAVLAILAGPVSASIFSVPKLNWDHFSLGTDSWSQPGTTTKVEKAISPLGDLSTDKLAAASGISPPFFGGGISPFRSPVTAQQSYTRTVMTPEGPKTQIVSRNYDGPTGERTTTVTNA